MVLGATVSVTETVAPDGKIVSGEAHCIGFTFKIS